ncbi:MAG: SIMPL domain-containing protein [Burkholderiaceae bacterium]|nr:SIMPL domain-containing protein [Burkholderiaceae bacterium]
MASKTRSARVVVAAGMVIASAMSMPAMAAEPLARIAVAGEASRAVEPDTAHADVGVVAEAESASEALKQNSAAMARVLDSLEGRGIASTDIQTRNFSITRRYRRGSVSSQPQPDGYSVSNQVSVVVHDIGKLGGLLDALVRDGANRIDGVRFSIANPVPVMDALREAAIADARRRARRYAEAAGLTLGPTISVEETGARLPAPVGAQPAMMRSSQSVPIAPGQATLRIGVSVVFSAAPK